MPFGDMQIIMHEYWIIQFSTVYLFAIDLLKNGPIPLTSY